MAVPRFPPRVLAAAVNVNFLPQNRCHGFYTRLEELQRQHWRSPALAGIRAVERFRFLVDGIPGWEGR